MALNRLKIQKYIENCTLNLNQNWLGQYWHHLLHWQQPQEYQEHLEIAVTFWRKQRPIETLTQVPTTHKFGPAIFFQSREYLELQHWHSHLLPIWASCCSNLVESDGTMSCLSLVPTHAQLLTMWLTLFFHQTLSKWIMILVLKYLICQPTMCVVCIPNIPGRCITLILHGLFQLILVLLSAQAQYSKLWLNQMI